MCGFLILASTLEGRALPHPAEELEALRDTLAHRGPDESGTWLAEDRRLALLHRRLRVIDLEGARQPMSDPSGRYYLAYNGEVYNYRELRTTLQGQGWRFRTAGDTEVVLAAFATWGEGCVDRLRGIFAFGVWDEVERRLFLARDHVGVKPLYYGHWDGMLYVASEAKAIVADRRVPRRIDPEALDLYFHYGWVPAPWGIWRGMRKLPAAHALTVDLAGSWRGLPQPRRYWEMPVGRPATGDRPEEEWLERLDATLSDSVRRQTVSDVPLGAFLSGGVDSSLVVSYLAEHASGPLRTFSVGYEDPRFDERRYARRVAERFATEHTELVVGRDSLERLPEMAFAYDEPFADPAALPTALLSGLARQRVTVVQSGDGGDETHAGYPRYLKAQRTAWLDSVPIGLRRAALGIPARLTRSWRRRGGLEQATRDAADRFDAIVAEVPWSHRSAVYAASFREALARCDHRNVGDGAAAWRREALGRPPAGATVIDRVQHLELTTYLPERLLTKLDRASMLVSLEARVPLLDLEAIELAAAIPAGDRVRHGRPKYLLRRLLDRRMGEPFADRRKHGFSVPLVGWFRRRPREQLERQLRVEGLEHWLEPSNLSRLLFDSRRGLEFLWPFLVFAHWYRRWGGEA